MVRFAAGCHRGSQRQVSGAVLASARDPKPTSSVLKEPVHLLRRNRARSWPTSPGGTTALRSFRREEERDRFSSISPQWLKIRRAAAIPDVPPHDLHHSFTSGGINHGVSMMVIGRLLVHALRDTTARYAALEDRTVG
jgi:integrase